MLAWLLFALSAGTALFQQPTVGFVPAANATVSGEISVAEGRISLGNSSVVTARDRTAVVTLERGGAVDVCQTSSLHITKSEGSAGLLLALDRGALELHLQAGAYDVLMTPDLRFSMATAGPLDLRLRVTRSGDTCVENRGKSAPAIHIADPFGDASYVVEPGQHVLFEHGHLNEVVDHEPTPCGCPVAPAATTSIAEAIVNGKNMTSQQAEAAHPFPAAISEGLADPTPLAPGAAGQVHAQVSAGLAYDSSNPPALTPQPAATIPSATSPATPPRRGVFHSIGHFFKRVFGTA